MTCKLCPTRKFCWDKGNCEDCAYGKAFEGYNKKLKRLKAENEKLKAENEALLQRLAENENGYEQTLYLERLKNKDLTAEVERLKDAHIGLSCKVGDKVYQTDGIRIYESTVMEVTYTTNKVIYCTENICFDETAIDKSIFLAKEKAEKALAEQEND